MKKKLWMIIGSALLVLVLVGAVGAAAVYAQSPTPTTPSGTQGRQGKFGNGPRGPHQLSQAELDAAAKALNMTSADLSAELKSGKTLSDIATEKGVSLQTVQQAIQSARDAQITTQINQAVANGKMTQDKANWLLEGLNKGYLNGPGFGFGFGFGPRGPHNSNGPQQGPQGQTPQQVPQGTP